MWWWWGKEWWWWWCGFSLISLFVSISWVCCFWLGLCYLDFDFFFVIWVLISLFSLFWVLISFFWFLISLFFFFFFFFFFFLFFFFSSELFVLGFDFILLWFRPEITRWFWLVQPMNRATRSDLNFWSTTGPYFDHPIQSGRMRVNSKPDPIRPVDSPNLDE